MKRLPLRNLAHPFLKVGPLKVSKLNWGQFLKHTLAGMVMICIEWLSFELGAFLTGTFGEAELGACGTLFQWSAFVFMGHTVEMEPKICNQCQEWRN